MTKKDFIKKWDKVDYPSFENDLKKEFYNFYEREVGHADVCKTDGYNSDGIIIGNCVCGASELWSWIETTLSSSQQELIKELEYRIEVDRKERDLYKNRSKFNEYQVRMNELYSFKQFILDSLEKTE